MRKRCCAQCLLVHVQICSELFRLIDVVCLCSNACLRSGGMCAGGIFVAWLSRCATISVAARMLTLERVGASEGSGGDMPPPTSAPAGGERSARGPSAGVPPPPAAAAAMAGGGGARAGAGGVDSSVLYEKEQTIQELRDTVQILELKITKLEQLVRLKDSRITTLKARLQAYELGGSSS